MKYERADFSDILVLADTLRASIVKNSEGENAYIDGYNDIVVGEKLGVSVHTVRNVRKGLFGKVKYSAPRKEAKHKADRIGAVEAKLTEALSLLREML